MILPNGELEKLNPHDLQLYFHEGYVLFTHPTRKKVEVGFCAGMDHEKLLIQDNERTFQLRAKEITPFFPKEGLYNWHNEFLHFCRVPARIASKSLTNKNGTFQTLRDIFIEMGAISPRDFQKKGRASLWTSGELTEVFCMNEALEFDEAFEDAVEGKFLGRTVDRFLGLSVGVQDEFPSLWYNHHYIGKALSHKRVLIEYPELFQEAYDLLSPKGVRVECI